MIRMRHIRNSQALKPLRVRSLIGLQNLGAFRFVVFTPKPCQATNLGGTFQNPMLENVQLKHCSPTLSKCLNSKNGSRHGSTRLVNLHIRGTSFVCPLIVRTNSAQCNQSASRILRVAANYAGICCSDSVMVQESSEIGSAGQGGLSLILHQPLCLFDDNHDTSRTTILHSPTHVGLNHFPHGIQNNSEPWG